MASFQDSVEALRQEVEKLYHANARFKSKVLVRQDDLHWEGDVFAFDLIYDTKNSGSTKEQIASWRLPGPSASALDAAERRGLKIKKALESDRTKNPEGHRKAKLAYAWSAPVKGSRQRKVHVVLHEGTVKSPADAVRAVVGRR
jgi:hypothetical protein